MSWFCRTPPDWARQLHLELHKLNTKVDTLMALVSIEFTELDALDVALDEATAAISARIDLLVAAGTLPAADVSALQADVENLRALSAPAPVEPPA